MFASPAPAHAHVGFGHAPAFAAAVPTPTIAAQLFDLPADQTPALRREDAPVPLWRAEAAGRPLGVIGSTWELASSAGYSGQLIDVLVALDPQGRIAGARLMAQSEPVLTLGISQADITRYVTGFRGYDTAARQADGGADDTLGTRPGLPDVISRATVSTGVIRDGILRTARILSSGAGVGQGGGIDRVGFVPADWVSLNRMGALGHASTSMAEAAHMLAGARQVPQPSEAVFLGVWAGLADPPTVGRNLLGQQDYTAAIAALQPGEALLALLTTGVQGHRGTDWRTTGRFERVTVTQGGLRLTPSAGDYIPVGRIAAPGAPDLRERSLFRLPADPSRGGLDVMQPFTVTVTASRPAAVAGAPPLVVPVSVEVRLPDALRIQPSVPLWREFWQAKRPAVGIVGAMLVVLALILLGQEWLVARPGLYRRVRLGYLAMTLMVLGWGLGGQLSVVQVIAFLHALLSGFRWEAFLIAPVIFVLWSAVALGMLFWGRGVFCGWLCPFGALQELTNVAARRLGLHQIAVPQAVHERLWVIKYSTFVGLVALSFYNLQTALVLAEVEPFKTAMSMRFVRAWPYVLYVIALLTAGLFIERFYCRYLCPLGAGLAIPAKLKVFDWLRRRPQCGRECRLCEARCTVGAIDRLGRINANECVLCLRCQVIMADPQVCPVLKRRGRGAPPPPQPAGAQPPPAFSAQALR